MSLAKILTIRSTGPLISAALRKVCDSAAFSYSLVLAIQLKVIWQIWLYRDMTAGDTGSYFSHAYKWAQHLETDIVWSPLYIAYYGTLYAILGDAYDATILHRALIVVLASAGVLAVARRMLPSGIALLLAIWWAVLPMNFDVFYEVHLFALLPILAAWLLAMRSDTAGSRGAALAMLVLTTVLVRNEYSIACLLYAFYCLWREIGALRSSHNAGPTALRRVLLQYAIPLGLALLVCLFFYWRTPLPNEQILARLHEKHTANMCQVYAFGFGQRHPEWTDNPWIACDGLMTQTFGIAAPTLSEMIRTNLPAVIDHFLWNLSLTGNGLQIALFDAASGQLNPDYTPRELGVSYPLWLSFLAVGIVAAGLALTLRDWRSRWSASFRALSYRWAPLLVVAVIALPVILTQRPRPDYLYALTFVLMLVIGTGLQVLTNRWARAVEICSLVIGIATLLLIPPYYPAHADGRPAKAAYERLRPYRSLLDALPGDIVIGDYAVELSNWIGLSRGRQTVLDYRSLPGWGPQTDACAKMDCRRVSALYVHARLMSQVKAAIADHGFCPKDPDGYPWLAVGTEAETAGSLLLIRKSPDVTLPPNTPAVRCEALQFEKPKPPPAPLPPPGVASFPSGLMAPGLLFVGVGQDGWLGAQARTKLALPGPSNALHLVGTIPAFQKITSGTLKVTVDGTVVLEAPMTAGRFDRVVTIPEAAGTRTIGFDMSGTDQLPDGRAVSVQLTSIMLDHRG
jgi:hypothetical protein